MSSIRDVKRKIDFSSSSSSAAAEESKQYMQSAVYYDAARFLVPRVANEFVSMRKTITFPNGLNANVVNGVLTVKTGTDVNQILQFEPIFNVDHFTANAAGIGNYFKAVFDEFRIRSVKVELIPTVAADVNVARMEVYKWNVANHNEEDIEANPTIPDYITMRQAAKTGESIKRLGCGRDHVLSMSYVPQIVGQDATATGIGSLVKDLMCPWMASTPALRAVVHRSPRFIFRLPYTDGTETNFVKYQVLVHAIIEFRNLDPQYV